MRILIIFIIVLTFNCLLIQSQTVPVSEPKVYVSPDGKIYFNQTLPVYFYVSASPDPNAPHYLLNSETTPKYANPMYFDVEGRNTLRSPSAVDPKTKKVVMPKIDVQYQMYSDETPPVSKISYDKSNEILLKGLHFLSGKPEISITSVDALSGTEKIMYSIDGQPYINYQSPIVFNSEKKYTLKYFSVDNTGNSEHVKEILFFPDVTAPKSSVSIQGPNFNEVVSGNCILSIKSSDTLSGIKQVFYSLDDSIFKPYFKGISTALISQGNHKLFYYATDKVNNREKVNIFPFFIDKTPPQVIEEVQGKTFTANGKEFSAGTSRLKITAIDNKAGIKEIYYSINNAPFQKYENPIVMSGYKGNLLIKSFAIDNVNNKSIDDASKKGKNGIPYVDLSAPWIGHLLSGPSFTDRDTVFINQKTKIVLEAKDTESGIQKIEYQLDSSDLALYSEPFKISKEGFHSISSYGYDNTDNMTRQEFGVMVDTIGPEIFERFSNTPIGSKEIEGKMLNEYPGHTVIFLSATDQKVGFDAMFYQLNSTPWLPYINNIKGFVKDKKNVLTIKATDKLGNYNEKTIEFFIR